MAVTPGEGSPTRRPRPRSYYHGQHSIPRQKPKETPSWAWDYKHHKPLNMSPNKGLVGAKNFNMFDELGNYFQTTGEKLSRNAANRSFIDETRTGMANMGQALENFADRSRNSRNRTAPNVGGGTSRSPAGGGGSPVTGGGGQGGILNQLLGNLMGSVQGTPPNMNFDKILQDTKDQVNKAYNAERRAVRGRSTRAKTETKQNRKELENMYAALSHAYNREAGRQDQETQKEMNLAGRIYNQQSNQAERDTNRTEGQESKLLQQLGIGAAGSETIPSGYNILQKEQKNIRGEKSKAKQIAMERGNIQERYLNTQGGLALEEGAQRSADQMDNLQNYLFQNRQALQDIAARRHTALAGAETDLAGQLGQQQQDYQNSVWDRLSDVMGFALDVKGLQSSNRLDRMNIGLDRQGLVDDRRQNQFENQLDLQKLLLDQQQAGTAAGGGGAQFGENSVLGQTDLGTAIRQTSTLGRQAGSKTMGVFNNLISDKRIQNGFVISPGGEKIDITPERAAAMAVDMGKKQGLGPHEIQLLRIAVLDYFK